MEKEKIIESNIKTQTVNGTKVEIMGVCGGNHVIVKVLGRNNLAQVDAIDLILPADELPKELAELKFHVKVEEKIEEVEEKA